MSYRVNDGERASGRVRRHRLVVSVAALGLGLAVSGCGRSSDAAGEIGDSNPSTETTAAVVAQSTTTTVATTTTTARALEYVIQSGDSLSIIAERFGLSTEKLANFNAITDANSIQIGQTLAIPPATIATDAAATTDTTVSEKSTTTAG